MSVSFVLLAVVSLAGLAATGPLDTASGAGSLQAGADSGNVIVVEEQRLSASDVADTTLVMERGRTTRIEIEIRANGSFKSYLNGLDSDFGTWNIRDELVCFEGRMRGDFCAPNLAGKRPGDRWVGTSRIDGRRYEFRLREGA